MELNIKNQKSTNPAGHGEVALELWIRSGKQQIGEIQFQSIDSSNCFQLFHHLDFERSLEPDAGGLVRHLGAEAARGISLYAEDGTYRFAKAQVNLRRGWLLEVEGVGELRRALDHFYPAALGLELARQQGRLEVEHLRSKLGRQTGMYRYARTISDAGAQELVRRVCGPAHQCARRILWQLDENTPLEDSAASRYDGIPGGGGEAAAIPLLCREACNHFVAECRKAAKAEFESQSAAED